MQWNRKGNGFTINNTPEFLERLKKTYRGVSYDELLAKLRLFNFRCIGSENEDNEFKHPFFKKNRYRDLIFIKKAKINRKIEKKSYKVNKADQSHISTAELKEQINKLNNVIEFVIQKNNQLVNTNTILMSQLSMLKSQCDGKMTEVLSMLLSTMVSSDNLFIKTFAQLFDELNINKLVNIQETEIKEKGIDYLKFYQTAIGSTNLSLFTLFERMTSAFELSKTQLIATVASQTVTGLHNYQNFTSDPKPQSPLYFSESTADLSTLAQNASKDSVADETSLKSPVLGFRAKRRFSRDDFALEEIKCVDRVLKDDEEGKETVSLSDISYLSQSSFLRDEL